NDISYNAAEGTLTFDYMEDSILSIQVTQFNENNKTIYTNTPLTTLKSYFKVSATYASTVDSEEPLKPLTAFVVQIDENNGKLVEGSNSVTIFTSDYAKSTTYTIENVQELEYTQIITLNFSQTTFTYPVTAEQIRDKISLFKVKRNDEQTVDVDKSEATVEGDLSVGTNKQLTLKLGDLSKTFNVTINKGTYVMDGVELSGTKTVTYDGDPHALTLSGTLPEGVTPGDITYTKQGGTPSTTAPTDAGTYAVKVSFTGDSTNYNTINDVTATLTINKATHEISADYEKTKQFTYTGEKIALPANWIDVPAGVDVKYYEVVDGVVGTTEFTGATDIKVYNLKAVFTVDDPDNYEVPTAVDLIFQITNKKIHKMGGTEFKPAADSGLTDDGNNGFKATYTGAGFDIGIELGDDAKTEGVTVDTKTIKKLNDGGNPDNSSDWTTVSKIEGAGTYKVEFTFKGASDEYEVVPPMSTTVTIDKADVDASGASFKPSAISGLTADDNGGYKATYKPDSDGFKFTVADLDPDSIPAAATPKTPVYKKLVNGNWETVSEIKEAGEYKVVVEFDPTDPANYNGGIDPVEIAITIDDAVVTGVTAKVESDAAFNTASTLDDVKAKLTAEIEYNNGNKDSVKVEDLEITCDGLHDGKLKAGKQVVNVKYSDGVETTVEIEVAKVKVALPMFKGGLKYTGVELKPKAENFNGYDENLMTFVVDKTIPGLTVGSYKAVFALNDPENYEWSTATTLKKTVFAVAVYDEMVLNANEAAVDWNISKAVLTATKTEGGLPVFASDSFIGAFADVVTLKYYKDEACTEEVAAEDLARETQYYVKAELIDTDNFELDASAAQYTVKSFTYTTPAKELTVWDKVVRFLKANWLWLVIAVVALILLITIIACAARAAKKKREREERRLAEEKAERERKEERDREERRLEREERMARLSQQQQAMPQMMMPQMTQMPQMPQQQPQYAPQQQPMATGGGASSNEIAELKAEISAMKAEAAAKESAALRAEVMRAEQAAMKAEQNAVLRSDVNAIRGEQFSGLNMDAMTEIMTRALKNVFASAAQPVVTAPPAQPAQLTDGSSSTATANAVYPPDAVMTTVTTTKIDTTKKPAQSAPNADRAAPGGRTIVRNVVAPMPVDDGRIFDVGGFYKPADPVDMGFEEEDKKD
ncbi:MAG: hypothetical protein K2I17_04095, partial [Clostridia bacterium]|nr:hypothetical protein [Clostridia bacterium]